MPTCYDKLICRYISVFLHVANIPMYIRKGLSAWYSLPAQVLISAFDKM